MLPSSSDRLRPLPAALLVLALALPGTAAAMDIELEAPRLTNGSLWVQVTIADPFSSRIQESLSRGMPARLQLHAELWRRRSGWFDRMERSFDAELRMRYDVALEGYRLERTNASPYLVSTVDSLAWVVSRPMMLPIARVDALQPDARYYVAVTATLKPLSVEDVQEIEGWLSGEVQTQGGSGFGVITGLPRSLFDAVRNFAGFGDQHKRTISADFRLSSLPPGR